MQVTGSALNLLDLPLSSPLRFVTVASVAAMTRMTIATSVYTREVLVLPLRKMSVAPAMIAEKLADKSDASFLLPQHYRPAIAGCTIPPAVTHIAK